MKVAGLHADLSRHIQLYFKP